MISEKTALSKIYFMYVALFIIINIVNRVSLLFIDGNIAFIFSIIWIIVTIVIYYFIRKNKKGIIIYSIMNAIVAGIATSSYYSIKSVEPYNPLVFIIAFGLLMYGNFLFITKCKNKKLWIKVNIIFSVVLMISSVYIWIANSAPIGSGMAFLSMVYLCFNIALILVINSDRDHIKILGYASLFMYSGVLIIVIIAVTESGFDFLEVFWEGKSKKKKV